MPLHVLQLAELIEDHAASLRLWVRSRSASCDDVVQEAFCRLSVEEPPPDRPIAWLYRVCRNLAEKERLSDDRRRRREELHAKPESLRTDPAESLEVAEMLRSVESLDDELREVLVARIWGGLSFADVAALCGTSTATAYRRFNVALSSLRLKLDAQCKNDP